MIKVKKCPRQVNAFTGRISCTPKELEEYRGLVGQVEFTVINRKDRRVIKVFVLEQWMVDNASTDADAMDDEYCLIPFTNTWKKKLGV